MRIDGPLVTQRLADVPAAAQRMEADGYDGAFTFEGPHDPFLPLMPDMRPIAHIAASIPANRSKRVARTAHKRRQKG